MTQTQIKSSRTPYEIRLELLQLAQKVLSDQHLARAVDKDPSASLASSAPTSQEIMDEAEKFNGFVSRPPAPR